MPDLAALPGTTGLFLDPRDDGRLLRVSWHEPDGVVVLSLWRTDSCVGTFRLAVSDVPAFVDLLVTGLGDLAEQALPTPRRASGTETGAEALSG